MLYGMECWKVKQENKISIVEMRMMAWMCGNTREEIELEMVALVKR